MSEPRTTPLLLPRYTLVIDQNSGLDSQNVETLKLQIDNTNNIGILENILKSLIHISVAVYINETPQTGIDYNNQRVNLSLYDTDVSNNYFVTENVKTDVLNDLYMLARIVFGKQGLNLDKMKFNNDFEKLRQQIPQYNQLLLQYIKNDNDILAKIRTSLQSLQDLNDTEIFTALTKNDTLLQEIGVVHYLNKQKLKYNNFSHISITKEPPIVDSVVDSIRNIDFTAILNNASQFIKDDEYLAQFLKANPNNNTTKLLESLKSVVDAIQSLKIKINKHHIIDSTSLKYFVDQRGNLRIVEDKSYLSEFLTCMDTVIFSYYLYTNENEAKQALDACHKNLTDNIKKDVEITIIKDIKVFLQTHNKYIITLGSDISHDNISTYQDALSVLEKIARTFNAKVKFDEPKTFQSEPKSLFKVEESILKKYINLISNADVKGNNPFDITKSINLVRHVKEINDYKTLLDTIWSYKFNFEFEHKDEIISTINKIIEGLYKDKNNNADIVIENLNKLNKSALTASFWETFFKNTDKIRKDVSDSDKTYDQIIEESTKTIKYINDTISQKKIDGKSTKADEYIANITKILKDYKTKNTSLKDFLKTIEINTVNTVDDFNTLVQIYSDSYDDMKTVKFTENPIVLIKYQKTQFDKEMSSMTVKSIIPIVNKWKKNLKKYLQYFDTNPNTIEKQHLTQIVNNKEIVIQTKNKELLVNLLNTLTESSNTRKKNNYSKYSTIYKIEKTKSTVGTGNKGELYEDLTLLKEFLDNYEKQSEDVMIQSWGELNKKLQKLVLLQGGDKTESQFDIEDFNNMVNEYEDIKKIVNKVFNSKSTQVPDNLKYHFEAIINIPNATTTLQTARKGPQAGGAPTVVCGSTITFIAFSITFLALALVLVDKLIERNLIQNEPAMVVSAFTTMYVIFLSVIALAGGIDARMMICHISMFVVLVGALYYPWVWNAKKKDMSVFILFAWILSLWWSMMIE